MRLRKFAVAAAILILIAFAIPIEHKYDKLFRFFSKELIPQGLNIAGYDKKIYFYASDLLALTLVPIGLVWMRIPWRRFFGERGAPFLWVILLCGLVSIITSPFSHYPVA